MNGKTKQIAELLKTGGKHAGDMVWWSLTEDPVKAAAFRQAWKDGGLNEALLPEDPTPGRSLKVACDHVASQQPKSGTRYVFRPADGDSKEQTVFAIMREERPAPGKVIATQEARVAVDGKGGFLSDSAAHPLVQAVRSGFDRVAGCFLAQEVRHAILRSLKPHAPVSLRPTGGIYWVPPQGAETVRAMEKVVEATVKGASFAVVPVFDTPEGNAAIGAAAHGSLEAELQALEAEMADFAKRAEGKDGEKELRTSTIRNRLEDFETIRSRANLYHTVLSVKVDDLAAKIAELEAQAQTVLGVLEKEEAKAS